MKILVIGNDPKIFDENLENFKRAKEYADLFDEYHIVSSAPPGTKKKSYGNRLFLWPAGRIKALFIGDRVIKKFRPDLIDTQDSSESGLLGLTLSKIYGIPLRVQIHTDVMSPWYRKISFKEWIRYRLAIFIAPKANCIRVVSERIKKSLVKLGIEDKKITVLPIFTDMAGFAEITPDLHIAEKFKDFEFKMIAAGRLVDKEKNFSMLIRMMPEFLKICPKAVLVLAGEGPDEEFYRSQITSYGLENHVILEGWREDLPSLLKCFDIFLLPSNYEGWGRVVIEAMASGLPVVMTEVGLAREVIHSGHNGMIVPVGKQEEFLRACINLYSDSLKRRRLGEEGRKTVLSLKPQNKEEYLELYLKSLQMC